MRVLVVEDDPGIRRQLALALARAGYVVETASDGEQGCYFGDSLQFDVAILDMRLPLMSGLEILHRWRRDGRSMPVLVLTGDDAFSTKLTALDSGADDYLTKPFMMQEILARPGAGPTQQWARECDHSERQYRHGHAIRRCNLLRAAR